MSKKNEAENTPYVKVINHEQKCFLSIYYNLYKVYLQNKKDPSIGTVQLLFWWTNKYSPL